MERPEQSFQEWLSEKYGEELWFNRIHNEFAIVSDTRSDGLLKIVLEKERGVLLPSEMEEFGYVYVGQL